MCVWVSAGNWTLVLCKSNICTKSLSHLSSSAFRSQWLEILRILTISIETQLRISVTRLLKSLMGILIMFYEKDRWNYMYFFPIEIFCIFSVLIYVALKWALVATFFLHHDATSEKTKGRRILFGSVSKISAYGYLSVLFWTQVMRQNIMTRKKQVVEQSLHLAASS